MKLTNSLVATLLIIGLSNSIAGDITGKITLKGTPPAEVDITPLKEDPTCGKLVTEMPTTHFYVVSPQGELADVVVMLKGISGKSTGGTAKTVEIDQKGCQYVPQILAVQTGQKIDVKNSDPVMHNVHTVPDPASGNVEKNLPQAPGAADLVFSMDKPENFLKFSCDVHRWMFAWVTVVDHPYFAISGKDGTYTIKDVPPGEYTITALHRKISPKGVDQKITVSADGAKADFTLEIK